MDKDNPSLEALQDIKRIMERSSRFISLSGLSGFSAGVCALVGACVAGRWLTQFERGDLAAYELKLKLLWLGLAILILALSCAFFFTWRKAKLDGLPLWDHSSRKLLINLLVPLVAGGFYAGGLVYHDQGHLVPSATLVFYGLALVNSSKYTLGDIRYMGLLEILLGLVSMFYTESGLYFWAVGFGVLHMVYGLIMWRKYDRRTNR